MPYVSLDRVQVPDNLISWLEYLMLESNVVLHADTIMTIGNDNVMVHLNDNATQQDIDDAQIVADGFNTLNVLAVDDVDVNKTVALNNGIDFINIKCTEHPSSFNYKIIYDDRTVESQGYDPDGVLQLNSFEVTQFNIIVADPNDSNANGFAFIRFITE